MKPRKIVPVVWLAFVAFSTGLAKKPAHPAPHPASAQMTPEQKAIHALNRLTFGAHPGDVEAVQSMGLDRWIDQQLHPRSIPENPVLETKLVPFDTLRMSTEEMV